MNKKAAENEDKDYRMSLGLALNGFPIRKNRINEAILTEWSRDYNLPNVVGQDIVQLMQDSLDKYNIPCRIDAVCADSVGLLLSGAFDKGNTRMAMSLDRNCNAAYIE